MRIFFTFLFSFFCTFHLWAQLNGDGYYRVQNQFTSRYVVVLSNKGDVNYATTEVDLGSIETIKSFDKVVSNPASIIYIEKKGTQGYVLKSQGTDTYSMIGYYLKIKDNKDGTYLACASANGVTKYLSDEPTELSDGILLTTGTTSRKWYINPVAADGDNYFGLKSDLTVGGDNYATIYASFPFSLASTGMAAYYIYKVEDNVAVYKEIKDVVPAATPVFVKCVSDSPSKNKLNLEILNVSSIKDNKLGGVYFNNKNKKIYNRIAYDPSTMRVLGKLQNGSLGFIKANIDYLPANKAYLNVPVGSADEISLMSYDEYTSGINDVVVEQDVVQGVYTLSGVKLQTNPNQLPSGIYIINGKKVVVE